MGASESLEMNSTENDANNNVNEQNMNDLKDNLRNLDLNREDIVDNTSLAFHTICGKNIKLGSNKRVATRYNGFCNAIVFSNRRIHANEIVYVKFKQISNCWSGNLRFGFSINDPNLNQNEIINGARYVCPDLTNKYGYWARALSDIVINENDILYFYFNLNGKIYYGINEQFKGLLFNDIKINPKKLFWALFDIYGNTTSIEFVDPDSIDFTPVLIRTDNECTNTNTSIETASSSIATTTSVSLTVSNASSLASSNRSLNSLEDNSLTPSQRSHTNSELQVDSIFNEFRRLHDNDLNESLVVNSMVDRNQCDSTHLTRSCSNENINLMLPIYKLLHHSNTHLINNSNTYKFNTKLFGKNVKFSYNSQIAYRSNYLNNNSNAYVFIDKEVLAQTSICIQIVHVDLNNNAPASPTVNNFDVSLGFGCTNCPLNELKQNDLPEDSYDLLNRNEYWIINKNTLNNATISDELCFILDASGNIQYKVNGQTRTKCLFNVDLTQKLYFFFDLCGKTTAIRLIPSCKQQIINDTCNLNQQKTSKASLQLSQSTIHDLNNMNVKCLNKKTIIKEECRVCLDASIECVLYACGHMCLCWNCAIKILNDKKSGAQALCPICRSDVKDVIRVYKS